MTKNFLLLSVKNQTGDWSMFSEPALHWLRDGVMNRLLVEIKPFRVLITFTNKAAKAWLREPIWCAARLEGFQIFPYPDLMLHLAYTFYMPTVNYELQGGYKTSPMCKCCCDTRRRRQCALSHPQPKMQCMLHRISGMIKHLVSEIIFAYSYFARRNTVQGDSFMYRQNGGSHTTFFSIANARTSSD